MNVGKRKKCLACVHSRLAVSANDAHTAQRAAEIGSPFAIAPVTCYAGSGARFTWLNGLQSVVVLFIITCRSDHG